MVSLPAAAGSSSPLLGFLPITDFNLQQQAHQQVQHQFAAGDTLTASVAALPSAATAGRLLLSVPLTAKPLKAGSRAAGAAGAAAGAKGQAREQQPVAPATGSCVEATVGVVHALHADLALAGGCHGRLYITEAAAADGVASPLVGLLTGTTLKVAVLGRVQTPEGRRHGMLECSIRPEVVAAAQQGKPLPQQHLGWGTLNPGQQLHG